MNTSEARTETETRKFFTLFVDGQEHRIGEATITGAEIMALGGIPQEAGLLLIEDDGTQRIVTPEEIIELRPGRRFRKAPRFKRGSDGQPTG